ncbi:hypothetical protein LJC32_05485 [Oscillospiraceae bacterium OttesenSCG-928-F05]|nr:hypothetical protein [Oscillospiraceae bacterium OttesenSCG-928-F05]
MSRYVKVTAAIGVFLLTATAIGGLYFLVPPPASSDIARDFDAPAEPAAAELARAEVPETDPAWVEPQYYTAKTYEGFVAIYRADSPEIPDQVTEIAVDRLRRADADMLFHGITVRGEAELHSLLEDLGS